jgi:hypothetical protein
VGGFRHGWSDPGGQAIHGLAVGPLLRAVGRRRSIRDLRAGHVPAGRRAVDPGRHRAAGLIGFGMGGESDVTPYLLSRYFGIRSFSTLYGFTWTAYAIAGAVGPIVMGRAFDAMGSYSGLLVWLAAVTLAAGSLMLLLPRYPASTSSAMPTP